ncbi:MAG: hypothetical protein Q7J27_12155 [Syntrophales bacterium]|nr:hypothetical protein [Syntrophales bacterium]
MILKQVQDMILGDKKRLFTSASCLTDYEKDAVHGVKKEGMMMRALHNTNIVIASEAKQSHNILIIRKIAASLKLLAMTRIAVLQSSHDCKTEVL